MSAKTERVRILVAIDAEGKWVSRGNWSLSDRSAKEWILCNDLDPGFALHWIEADVPVPEETTIAGVVTECVT